MVKMFAILRRKPGTTVEEFRDHWKNRHGPLILSRPNLARHIVRYEQHPRHRGDAMSGTKGVDGVAVQWFNSIDDFIAFCSEPEYAEYIAPDEKRFLDVDTIEFLITDEPNVVIDGSRSASEAGPVADGDPTSGAGS
jgi:uncharacterized protein (TIGR02118 family)